MKKSKLEIFLWSIWICLTILLIIYILYGSKVVMNSDSAFITDYSLEQIRTLRIFPTGWMESNDFWIYSLIPLITLFVKTGISLFASRQFAVLFQSIFLFFILFKIFYSKKEKNNFLIPGLIIISGISGQMLFEIFGDATYGSIIVYILFTLYIFMKYINAQKEKKSKKFLIIIFIAITFLTMCSMRFPIYLSAGLISTLIFMWLSNNQKGNKKLFIVFIVIVISTGLGYFLNKYLQSSLIYNGTFYKSIVSNSNSLFQNFQNTVYNFLMLTGSTNTNVFTLTVEYKFDILNSSPWIIMTFVRFIYSIFLVLLPFILLKKVKEFNNNEKIVYIFTCSLTFIIFFFTIIGGLSNWYRYLVPVVFFLNLLIIIFYKYNLKNKKQKILFGAFSCLFILFSIFANVSTYYDFKNPSFKSNKYQGLTSFLLDNNLYYGFEYTDKEHNLYSLLSNNELKVLRIKNPMLKPDYWLSSKDWFKQEYYEKEVKNKKIFFMRYDVEPMLKIEERAMEKYLYENIVITVYDDYNIVKEYFLEDNEIFVQ